MTNTKEIDIIWNLMNNIVSSDTEIEELEDELITYMMEIDGLLGIINDQKETIKDLKDEVEFLEIGLEINYYIQ